MLLNPNVICCDISAALLQMIPSRQIFTLATAYAHLWIQCVLCLWLQLKRNECGNADWQEPNFLLVMSRYLWRMSQLLDQLPGTQLPVSHALEFPLHLCADDVC